MTRGKQSKRAGTRGGGGTNVGKKPRAPLPDDLADAAEAALADLLSSSQLEKLDEADLEDESPRAREGAKGRGLSTHEVSLEEIIPLDEPIEDEGDEPLTSARPRRLPSKVAPLKTATPPPAYKPPARLDPEPSIDATNPVEHTELEEIADDEGATAFAGHQRRGIRDDDDSQDVNLDDDDDGMPPTRAGSRGGAGSARDALPARPSSDAASRSAPHTEAAPSRISSSHAAVTPPGQRVAHTIPRPGNTPPRSAVPSPMPPEDTSAHTIARDDAGFGHAVRALPPPPAAPSRTPTPQPSAQPPPASGRAPLPPPSGLPRSSVPSSGRLPLPAPADSRMHDPETIEATTSREPGKGSHATIDMQNARHGQLTRQAPRPDAADARRAYLESARFERDAEQEQQDALDNAELDSEPFERDDSAPFDREAAARFDRNESAPFERIGKPPASEGRAQGGRRHHVHGARADRFGRGDSAPFAGDSEPFEREISAVFNEGVLENALAGLDADRASSSSEPVSFEVPALRFAVYEDSAYLASAQNAIIAAGHVIAAAGAGRDALKRVGELVKSGGIDVVLVSLPGGESIIDAARTLEPMRPTIIASLSASSVEAVEAATASGADLATTRPHDVERIAPLALAAARIDVERRAAASAKGAEQVLRQRLEDLADAEPGGLLPLEAFQRVLELEIKRAKRFLYPLSVALFAVDITPPLPPPGIIGILRARAGNALINTIRDIDIATQIDHERFLVLLPYTDLKGAAVVGKRVIAAVGKGQPVVSDGRSFPPRVVGACAGMKKGEPVSFAKLMKDATRALESARRDGADLAVQP